MEISEIRAVVSESRWCGRALDALMGLLCLWLVVVVGLAEPAARAHDCALKVKVDEQEETAYRRRGNRCEGTYDKPAANRINLRIVGFHLGAPVFDPRKDLEVRIAVRPLQVGQKILLRVTSTRYDAYQMDTSAFGADGTFTWPLDVVRILKEPLIPFDTAALACSAHCDSDRATLLPVSLSGSGAVGDDTPRTLTLIAIADVELRSLKATLRIGDKIIFDELDVEVRNLPPYSRILIPMDDIASGEALFSLSAVTLSGQRDYIESILLIPSRGK